MKKILVLHGPNLNHLGLREPAIYGSTTLTALNEQLQHQAISRGFLLTCLQTNNEAILIDAIYHAIDEQVDFIIINPAAFGHTSIAIRDALIAAAIPFIEVHISNIYARESFRHHSFLSDIAQGVISGLGIIVYSLALQAISDN
jgi:3-dehydroquinate dehydratase-2